MIMARRFVIVLQHQFPAAWPETACRTSGQISGVSSSHQIVSGTPGLRARISSMAVGPAQLDRVDTAQDVFVAFRKHLALQGRKKGRGIADGQMEFGLDFGENAG
jgi:hypothetical protein